MLYHGYGFQEEKTMKRTLIALTFLALAAAVGLAQSAAPANVGGAWEITVTTPRGDRTSDMTIVQDGENIKVTVTSPRGETTGEGTIKGNEISWTVTRTTPRGEMTSTYKGKVDGDTMSGDVEMGNFGSAPWKAARKKA
jgi:uncharacterized protein (DUF2147 family)